MLAQLLLAFAACFLTACSEGDVSFYRYIRPPTKSLWIWEGQSNCVGLDGHASELASDFSAWESMDGITPADLSAEQLDVDFACWRSTPSMAGGTPQLLGWSGLQPFGTDDNTSVRAGAELSFGRYLADRSYEPVILSAARSSSPISGFANTTPGTLGWTTSDWYVARLADLGEGVHGGAIIILGGESDALDADYYPIVADSADTRFAQIEARTGVTFDWHLWVQLAPRTIAGLTYGEEVLAQQAVWRARGGKRRLIPTQAAAADANDLGRVVTAIDWGAADIHYPTASLVELGSRAGELVQRLTTRSF